MSSTFIKTALLACLLTFSAQGCSSTANEQSQSKGPSPIFKVDAAHSHILETTSATTPPMYEMAEGNQFQVDLNNYPTDVPIAPSGSKKVIEIITGQFHGIKVPLASKQQLYTITVPSDFKSGQQFAVGIGAENQTKEKIDFYPAWVGMVKIK